jgi:hypothetical protein
MNFFSFFAFAFAVVKDVSHRMDVPISVPPFAIFSPLPDSKVSNNPLESCIGADRNSPWLFRSNQNSPRPFELSESILPLLNQRFFSAPKHLLSPSLLPSSFQAPYSIRLRRRLRALPVDECVNCARINHELKYCCFGGFR